MNRGTAKPVSLKNVVASAKRALRITDGSHDADLTAFADEALLHMWTADTYIKRTECIEICNMMFPLPNGFIRPIAMELVGDSKLPESLGLNRVLYFDKNYLKQCDCEVEGGNNSYPDLRQTGQIIGGNWVFNTTNSATHAVITFEGRNLDEDCLMVMYDFQIRAVRAYICYNFARTYHELFRPDVMQSYQQEWTAQRRYLVGEANVRNYRNQKTQIKSIASALVYNTNFSI
jgi:hypothetical protein